MKLPRQLLNPWTLIIAGILLNILSATLNHYLVSTNSSTINTHTQSAMELEQKMDKKWSRVMALGAHEDTLSLFFSTADLTQELNALTAERLLDKLLLKSQKNEAHLKTMLFTHIQKNNKGALLGEVFTLVNQYRQETLNEIDELYLDKILLEKEIAALKATNESYNNLALFLQLFGLILVTLPSAMMGQRGKNPDEGDEAPS